MIFDYLFSPAARRDPHTDGAALSGDWARVGACLFAALALVACEKDNVQPSAPVAPTQPPTFSTAPAVLATPENGATGLWTPCTYEWSAVQGAARYELVATVTTEWGQTGPLLTAPNLQANSYTHAGTLASNLHGGAVTWKVRAWSADGIAGSWTDPFVYTLEQ